MIESLQPEYVGVAVAPRGSPADPGRELLTLGLTRDATGSMLAWVEEDSPANPRGYVRVQITVKVARDGGLILEHDLDTYNPCFGCSVHFLEFRHGSSTTSTARSTR